MAHFLRAKLLKSEPAVLGLPLGKLGFAWFGEAKPPAKLKAGRNKSCPKFCLVIACGDTPMQNQAAPQQNRRFCYARFAFSETRGGRATAQLQNSSFARVRASPLVLFRRCFVQGLVAELKRSFS